MSDVKNMMLEDTKDMLDNIEITDIAQQCVLLKQKEDGDKQNSNTSKELSKKT